MVLADSSLLRDWLKIWLSVVILLNLQTNLNNIDNFIIFLLMKKLYLKSFLLGSALVCSLGASAYDTAGNGTVHTLASLAAIENSGVTKVSDNVYLISDDVNVSANDSFVLEGGLTVKMAGSTTLRIEGHAKLGSADARTKITRNTEADTPKGIYVLYDGDSTMVYQNLDFEYASLRGYGYTGFSISNSTFKNSNGKLSTAGALTLGQTGAVFNITDCTFENNTVPGIGSAANIYCGVTVNRCTFIDNNQENSNKPQINISVGGNMPVVIKNSTITGTGRDKVGGIGINNVLSTAGTNNVLIDSCTITKNRYGITGIGPMNCEIRNCFIKENKYDSNPMSGGSGISMYMVTTSIISKCHIEDNLWGVTVISCKSNLGEVGNPASPGGNVFVNNGNGGVAYDLYNNSTNTVYAQLNTWSVPEQTAEEIEKVIFHKNDNPKLGEVIFMPAQSGSSGVSDATARKAIEFANGVVSGADGVEIEVYNVYGQRVGSSVGSIDLTDMPPGMYIVRQGGEVLKIRK